MYAAGKGRPVPAGSPLSRGSVVWMDPALEDSMARPNSVTPATHGTVSKWRNGCRCKRCTKVHGKSTTEYRRLGHPVDDQVKAQVIEMIGGGHTPSEVEESIGMSWMQVAGRTMWDPEWRERLDEAWTRRFIGVEHGQERIYKQGCRCTDCKAAHRPRRLR